MLLSTLRKRYSILCFKCHQELYGVGFGSESDKLKCFNCNVYYDYHLKSKVLKEDNDYSKLLKKWDTGSGEYPGIPTSQMYSPWYLKMGIK